LTVLLTLISTAFAENQTPEIKMKKVIFMSEGKKLVGNFYYLGSAKKVRLLF
jgi:hypothetical protein